MFLGATLQPNTFYFSTTDGEKNYIYKQKYEETKSELLYFGVVDTNTKEPLLIETQYNNNMFAIKGFLNDSFSSYNLDLYNYFPRQNGEEHGLVKQKTTGCINYSNSSMVVGLSGPLSNKYKNYTISINWFNSFPGFKEIITDIQYIDDNVNELSNNIFSLLDKTNLNHYLIVRGNNTYYLTNTNLSSFKFKTYKLATDGNLITSIISVRDSKVYVSLNYKEEMSYIYEYNLNSNQSNQNVDPSATIDQIYPTNKAEIDYVLLEGHSENTNYGILHTRNKFYFVNAENGEITSQDVFLDIPSNHKIKDIYIRNDREFNPIASEKRKNNGYGYNYDSYNDDNDYNIGYNNGYNNNKNNNKDGKLIIMATVIPSGIIALTLIGAIVYIVILRKRINNENLKIEKC
ncbi:expressed protein [Dictyostelium purpureum]|uniref:Expressed protein n=1 Tax=Dictyostelium purpureum TaxID=5786 RepID=F0ZE94_DICPU|nr:uncharacterized protein DICPUDRAFT_94009 [Dictyostelium purpureum]EGC37714.1 expressed protein [Dictyostelium purpureum]|eukprot:XP_003285735.1 expressed protein [Dictyostelium purpureum]